ncbi:substrate-binding domain-containing protein [Vibrio sp. JC009]|uniref:substrate-binding domain-containing protein n=1 Tax=Vibrio sp. JC009 TaxID=2912314 RepID=UPI0023AE8E83|nr:substrate-binding domain-containing protein [Vibrio sp. JC009]WED20531.1 substrate-binding domain-containing protein [Vibrio sp. JC009]
MSKEAAIELQTRYPKVDFLFIDVPKGTPVNCVCCDNHQGANLAIKHLTEQNRKKVFIVAGPKNFNVSQLRLEPWLEAAKESGVDIVGIYEGNWLPESGFLAVQSVIAKGDYFDAVLCANDQMALGAIRALSEVNISIPGEVSVVGFDGIEDAAYYFPPLTTSKQDFILMGKTAVDTLVQNGATSSPERIETAVELLVRKSSVAAHAAHDRAKVSMLIKKLNSLI